jgi:hypothetical protein
MKRRLRLELHHSAKHGIEEHLGRVGEQSFQRGINRIDGLVRYVSGIEYKRRQHLRESWHAILTAGGCGPSYMPQAGRLLRKIDFIVDEAEFTRADTKFLALACATTEELEKIRFSTASAAREYRVDPFAPGRPGKVDSKGLHFTDLPETVRDTFIKTLASLPFRGYVGFAPLNDEGNYTALYLELLTTLMLRRFQAADRGIVAIYIEENPKLSLPTIKEAVDKVFEGLESRNDRRPVQKPVVIIATKRKNPELAIPDFMLGTLAHYLNLQNGGGDLDRLRFERLRDKFRVVLDLERRIDFSRRRPLLPW